MIIHSISFIKNNARCKIIEMSLLMVLFFEMLDSGIKKKKELYSPESTIPDFIRPTGFPKTSINLNLTI